MDIVIEDVRWPETMFEDEEPRADGLHLGDVIRSVMESCGLGYKGKGFTDMQLTAEIGLLWEKVLSKVMGEKYPMRPPQICKDGVWMSMDGIGPDPEGEVPLVVEEYKATWQSINRSPAENFYYMTQVKSYCHAIETNIAVMHIFYVMGDYKGSGPMYRKARLVFTGRELEENWQMILREKERMGQ